jgi:uncharacterized protein (UPF0335 family)
MVADVAETGVAAEELKQFIERIERLEEEKKAIADDVKDVFAEAKGRGFDTKAIRTIVRLRSKEPHEREEEEAILELYKSALGMASWSAPAVDGSSAVASNDPLSGDPPWLPGEHAEAEPLLHGFGDVPVAVQLDGAGVDFLLHSRQAHPDGGHAPE